MLGSAWRVVVNKDSTVIVDGGGSKEAVASHQAMGPRSETDSTGTARAAGAAGQAGRRRCSDQGRCSHRDRSQGSARKRSGTPLRQPRLRSKRASSPAAAPHRVRQRTSCAARSRAMGPSVSGYSRRHYRPRCTGFTTNAGLDGSVVVDKSAELGAGGASAPPRCPTATWSPGASSARPR